MAVRNLRHHSSLLVLRGEIVYTLDRLEAHPLTQGYVPVFEALRDAWTAVSGEELALRDGLSAANARVASMGESLGRLASCVSKALLTVTGDDRTHPLYTVYFKKTLAELRRHVLGVKLEAMRGWVKTLQQSEVPALAQLGAEVGAAVAAADEAAAARAALEAQQTFFRETGNRKKLFDRVNATRKGTHGELAKMPHEQVGVPAGFADQFFRHESGKHEAAPTLASVAEELAALKKQLAEKEALFAALEAEAERAAQEEVEKAAKQAAIAEIQRAVMDAERQAAEGRAKIAEIALAAPRGRSLARPPVAPRPGGAAPWVRGDPEKHVG